MQLEKIITIANRYSQLRFTAMERSLRSTGCKLPLWVIPYNDDLFALPEGAIWWEHREVTDWVRSHNPMPGYKKYSCLLEANYLFVDADVIFLRNPEEAFLPLDGFIATCGHWHNTGGTHIPMSEAIYRAASTTWQKDRFNAGQFGCSYPLYDLEGLKMTAENKAYKECCLDIPFHEQAGLNLLVHLSGTEVVNLTLPPYNLQSSWAGDYVTDDFEKFWLNGKKPVFIHWAGCNMAKPRPIDYLMLQHLTTNEQRDWELFVAMNYRMQNTLYKKLRRNISVLKRALLDAPVEW